MTYLVPILIFLGLGLLAGILLTVASNAFAVETDALVEEINALLPQANCGACGYAGCASYAEAVARNGEKTGLCKPGGDDVSKLVSSAMGVDADIFVPEVAVVHCNGTCKNTASAYVYDGMQSCVAAKRYFGGTKVCSWGCIGLGDCLAVCTNEAISISNGIASIDKKSCAACGLCVKACPNGLISLQPITKHYSVLCSSGDNGKQTRANCKTGCIGCKICEKACISGAIKIVNAHAVIDYTKCISCGRCFEACPIGAIRSCEVK